LNFFLKDVDDIRGIILSNFSKILRIFSEQKRDEHLNTLWQLASESDVNWRFRCLLAEQLDEICPLYKTVQVVEHIVPLTFQLCDDRMADVRYAAVVPITEIINYFVKERNQEQLEDVLNKCDSIQCAKTYSKRLLYVKLCQVCILRIVPAVFAERFLPKVLTYADDRISNVRYALARFLSSDILKNEQYAVREDVKLCVAKLKSDKEDVEVRRYFSTETEIESFLQKQQSPPTAEEAASPTTQVESPESGAYSSSEDYDDSGGEDADGKKNANKQTSGNEPNRNENVEPEATVTGEKETPPEHNTDNGETDTQPKKQKEDDLSERQVKKQLSAVDIEQPLQRQVTPDDEKEAAKNTAVYTESKQRGENFNSRLIHQPTPYRLPDLDEQSDTDSDEEDNHDENGTNQKNERTKKSDDPEIPSVAAQDSQNQQASEVNSDHSSIPIGAVGNESHDKTDNQTTKDEE